MSAPYFFAKAAVVAAACQKFGNKVKEVAKLTCMIPILDKKGEKRKIRKIMKNIEC